MEPHTLNISLIILYYLNRYQKTIACRERRQIHRHKFSLAVVDAIRF